MTQLRRNIAAVALNLPLDKLYHYRVPPALGNRLQAGCRVRVPFGRQGVLPGVCVHLAASSPIPENRLKDVAAALDSAPLFDERALALARWMARYYACSWGEALAALLPGGVDPEAESALLTVEPLRPPEDLRAEASRIAKRASRQARALRVLADANEEMPQAALCRQASIDSPVVLALADKGWIKRNKIALRIDPFRDSPAERDKAPTPTHEQAAALEKLIPIVDARRFRVVLIRGVTGSGKTEVYLRTLERVVAAGRQGIVLVPEISLTPQTVQRFRARFDRVAALHSNMTDRERRSQWRRIREGKADVVVGARSAVFAPTPDLGLLVVDEEHENSFKQDNTPRYNARDVGILRASHENALVLLGSATPSLESYCNARSGKYDLIELLERAQGLPMPPVEIVNMAEVMQSARRLVTLSPRLRRAIDRALDRKEQVILFLNRRGFATSIMCPSCGFTLKCGQCDVALTYHRTVDLARCHYCLHEEPPPDRCPACGDPKIKRRGQGTQRVEDYLKKAFEGRVVERMDTDSMRGRGKHQDVLSRFKAGEIHILLGTQMIAKGLDFPNVTVVGVLNADTSLNLPDFRSAERTFQLISQVAGRAGRSDKGGRVFVQTFSPEHECIRAAAMHDYPRYADYELSHRKEFGYPPFCRMARIVCEAKKARNAEEAAASVADALRDAGVGKGVAVLGPAPAPLAILRGKSRWHVCVKAPGSKELHDALAAIDRTGRKGVQVTVDVDPVSML